VSRERIHDLSTTRTRPSIIKTKKNITPSATQLVAIAKAIPATLPSATIDAPVRALSKEAVLGDFN
jgi:hypothetical protein